MAQFSFKDYDLTLDFPTCTFTVCADTGIHKHIGRQLNNAIQPIVFQNVLTDIGRAATGITREQRGTVLNNGHLAVRCKLG